MESNKYETLLRKITQAQVFVFIFCQSAIVSL